MFEANPGIFRCPFEAIMNKIWHSGRHGWIRKGRVSLSGVPGGLRAIAVNRILTRKMSPRLSKLFEGYLDLIRTVWGLLVVAIGLSLIPNG